MTRSATPGLRTVSCLAWALLGSVLLRAADPGEAKATVEPRYEFGAELRFRGESRFGGGAVASSEDSLGLSKLYLDFTFRPSRKARVVLQARDSRVLHLDAGRSSAGLRSPMDLRKAYVEVGQEDGAATLAVGRLQLDLIDSRLVGARPWSNISPTFDGSMLSLRKGGDRLDLIAVSAADIRDGFDVPSRTTFLYGAVGSITSWAKGHTIEPFFVSSRRPPGGRSNLGGLLRTTGSRFTGVLSRLWNYEAMLSAQFGGERDRPHRAWSGVWGIARTIESAPASPVLACQWTYASGDDDPHDGRIGSYNPLFASYHRLNGEHDVTGVRNISVVKTGVQLQPDPKVRVNVDFLDLRLASLRDGLYSNTGVLRVAAPDEGAASGFVGSEVDVVVRYQATERLFVRLGFSRFFAGDFVLQNAPGGSSQTFLYSALTLGF